MHMVYTLSIEIDIIYTHTCCTQEYTIASTNYTVCSSTYMDFWEVGIGLYNSLLLFLMLFLACQNARIPQHFREVNDNTHRVTLAIFIIVEFFFLLHILFKHVLNAGLFWIYYTAFPVTLTLAIAFTLFIPPVSYWLCTGGQYLTVVLTTINVQTLSKNIFQNTLLFLKLEISILFGHIRQF